MSFEHKPIEEASSHFLASQSEPGLKLHLRAREGAPGRPPVLFVHGAAYASRLYDLPLPGLSWLKATADAGFAAYALDVRGYRRSVSALLEASKAPYGRAADVIHDIDDAVDWIRDRHSVDAIRLAGGSWGTVTTMQYATTIGASKISSLLLFAPIYAERNAGWIELLADPNDASRLNPSLGPARLIDEHQTRERWDQEITTSQPADWRDEAALRALVDASIAEDPTAPSRGFESFRAPNGTLVDLWECFNARPLYEPGALRAPVALLRGSADQTSTRSDALALLDALGSADKQYFEIARASHFAVIERRAPRLYQAANAFFRATA